MRTRILPLIFFAAFVSHGNAAFSLLRLYPGSSPSGNSHSKVPKFSNPSVMTRQDGRRLDVVPEVVPLKLTSDFSSKSPTKRESLVRRIELGSTVTYVKASELGKKTFSKKNETKNEKFNFIDIKESSLKSQLEGSAVLSEAKKLDRKVDAEKVNEGRVPEVLPRVDKNVKSNLIDSNGFISTKTDDSSLSATTSSIRIKGINVSKPPSSANSRTDITTLDPQAINALDTESHKNSESADKKVTDSFKLPNSPIFYIRIPPSPYNYLPGFGYVSTPVMDKNVLPVDFSANGKPSALYYFKRPIENFISTSPATPSSSSTSPPTSSVFPQEETTDNIILSEANTDPAVDVTDSPSSRITPTTTTPRPPKQVLTNSKITYIKGNFQFNGRPNGVFAVHSPYKPDYFQILHDFFYSDRKKPAQTI